MPENSTLRNARSRLMSLLSRLSLGAYVALSIGVMGLLFYAGYHLGQSGNPAFPTQTGGLSDGGEKIRKLATELLALKSELQERMKSYEGLLNERDAQIKEHEKVISSLRNEIKDLQSKLIAEQ